jgi:hypothetical protein
MNAVCKLINNSMISDDFLRKKLVRLAGIEPTTLGFGGHYSIDSAAAATLNLIRPAENTLNLLR